MASNERVWLCDQHLRLPNLHESYVQVIRKGECRECRECRAGLKRRKTRLGWMDACCHDVHTNQQAQANLHCHGDSLVCCDNIGHVPVDW